MGILIAIVGIALFGIILYSILFKKDFIFSLFKTLIIGFVLTILLLVFASYLVLSPLDIKLHAIVYGYLFVITYTIVISVHILLDSRKRKIMNTGAY